MDQPDDRHDGASHSTSPPPGPNGPVSPDVSPSRHQVWLIPIRASRRLIRLLAALFLWRPAKPAVTTKNVTWEPGLFADSLIDKVTKT